MIPLEILAIVICFTAVTLIALQQRKQDDAAAIEGGDSEEDQTLIGLIFALSAGIMMAFCAVTTRALKSVPTPIVIFYHTIGGMLLTGSYVLIEMWVTNSPSRFSEYTARQLGIAVGASAFDTGALLSVTAGYQCDSSGFVSMLSYLNIVYAFICDQVVWKEKFNAIELLCTLVILVTALGVAIYKYRQQQDQQKIDESTENQAKNQPLLSKQ